MNKKRFDTIVLGGGPGGYVAAIRLAERGQKVALVEANELGGTCLNRGCIPSKALIASSDVLRKVKEAHSFGVQCSTCSFDLPSMVNRKDSIVGKLRKSLEGLIGTHSIDIVGGFGKFISPNEIKVSGADDVFLEAPNIIIATGSESRTLPHCPIDGTLIHDSTSFLNLSVMPKKLVIIGGGVIGCEFASLYQELGCDVTILEMLPSILPLEGKLIQDTLSQAFKKQGIKVETGVRVTGVDKKGKEAFVKLEDHRTFESDCVLVAVGRKFNTEAIGLEKTGVIVEKNGTIAVNDQMQTNIPHLFAIGDITGKWILAHVASHQGIVAAETIAGHQVAMDYRAVPSVIFTHPEVASVGLSLEKAQELGIDATVGKFPFQALGKSLAIQETDGFTQVVVSKKTGEILGAVAVGYQAATLIAEITLAMQNELTAECVADTIHAHPTISEAWMEASFIALGQPLHFPPKKPQKTL